MQINFKFQIRKFKTCHLSLGYWVIYLSFVIGLLGYSLKSAWAQTFSLSISPPLLEVIIMPGKSVSQNYELVNAGDPTEITAQIIPFEPEGEHGNIKFPVSSLQFPVSNWFSFENADIALEKPFPLRSGERKQIILKIKIPPATPEDDYYFSLLFASSPEGRLGSSGTTQTGVIGTNLLLTVSKTGQPVKKGEIVEFSLLSSQSLLCFPNLTSERPTEHSDVKAEVCLLDSFTRPEFLLRIKNTSRTFWKPFGKIKTEGLLGQKWEQELHPENILANSIRQINVATPSASPSFLIGPYRAKVEFTPDEEGPQINAATSFLALPIKALLAILTGLVLLFMIKSVILRSKK